MLPFCFAFHVRCVCFMALLSIRRGAARHLLFDRKQTYMRRQTPGFKDAEWSCVWVISLLLSMMHCALFQLLHTLGYLRTTWDRWLKLCVQVFLSWLMVDVEQSEEFVNLLHDAWTHFFLTSFEGLRTHIRTHCLTIDMSTSSRDRTRWVFPSFFFLNTYITYKNCTGNN